MAEENYIDAIRGFIKKAVLKHSGGSATELSYRSDLEELITVLGKKIVRPLNEARGTRKIGKPDITVIHSDNIAIGYLEAKDIGIPIRDFTGANKKQFDRYTENLDNLVYTNNLDWDFYRYGKRIYSISIGEYNKQTRKITLEQQKFGRLGDYLLDFLSLRPQSIKTPEELTEHMSRRTYMIRHTLNESMTGKNRISSLQGEYTTVVDELIKGLSKDEFADMYAQTITYGLLAARLNSTPETFSRKELQYLLPKGYPFLSKLLLFIATEDLGEALSWAIDDLIGLYRAADVKKIMKPYAEDGEDEDPFLHFYEEFLKQYNSTERKNKGAYYTPKHVVEFIVRGVDWVLKNKFKLREGLAHSDKIETEWNKNEGEEPELHHVHKVQILDPATGTGTFLAQTIRQIEKYVKTATPGNWDNYVDNDLLPRLNGFEIMIAPYAISYLKLDRELERTGYKPTSAKPNRMHIYLTNSLAKPKKKIARRSYNQWFTNEAQGAKDIKINKPIMCVIGNPPYSGISQNMGKEATWINELIEEYKQVDGEHFNERKHWLHNDYVKFIRLAQYMVDKNGEGVVGMITDHSYLEGPTFRGMRWNLMNSFDGIYVLDLHGSSDEKKFAIKGKDDENVFAIQQGVSIIIAWRQKWKNIKDKPLAQVFRGNLWGAKDAKFKSLSTSGLDSNIFQKIDPRTPDYYFKPVDYILKAEYDKGFKITDFMKDSVTGIVTAKDNLVIDRSKQGLINKINQFIDTDKTDDEIRQIFFPNKKEGKYLPGDSRGWKLSDARAILANSIWKKDIKPIAYRAFDTQYILYRPDMVDWGREKAMRHLLVDNNIGLIAKRGFPQEQAAPVFCTNTISDFRNWSSSGMQGGDYVFPLYLYPDDTPESKRPNMDENIRKKIETLATNSKNGTPDEYAIFDYIYGLLHAPAYRKLYGEFIKEDFPRISYPKTPAEFWHLSTVGTKLRKLHLMEGWDSPVIYTFKGTGDGVVKKGTKLLHWNNNKVWISKSQYFDNVPESTWEFCIGGYKPAQKWLSDRKGQKLKQKDIEDYQKIIAILVQTKTTMDEIEWSRP